MNLQQVRYFLAICEERNFTRAATRCRVRQPSLTAAIQRLERELGGALFVRSSPIRLSALGAALQPFFAQIDAAAQRARHIAADHASDRIVRNAPAAVAS
jgi:LysR family hydrogen peroxide-inducible transcriptional activator